MASRRMVPTRFFEDPDIMNLSSKDTQLILIGLILAADDEGREVAHVGLLGRKMDYPSEQIESALTELAANDLLLLYQVGKHRYYQLTRWDQWQTLGNKKTPSKYPDPPAETSTEQEEEQARALAGSSQKNAGFSQENRENSGESSSQSNLTESNLAAGEEKQTSEPLSPEEQPDNVLAFPTRADGGNVKHQGTMTSELAKILRVPVTSALTMLISEFEDMPDPTLLGEANAARAWVDDQRRKGKKTQMTLPFFRRWLQRSRTITASHQAESRAAETNQATGTTGQSGPPRLPSLMHLGEELRQRKGVNNHE